MFRTVLTCAYQVKSRKPKKLHSTPLSEVECLRCEVPGLGLGLFKGVLDWALGCFFCLGSILSIMKNQIEFLT